jgi:hypothetical protein
MKNSKAHTKELNKIAFLSVKCISLNKRDKLLNAFDFSPASTFKVHSEVRIYISIKVKQYIWLK